MSKRILIIDDEVSFTRLMSMNLEDTGDFEVKDEIGITAAIARGLENLVDHYIAKYGGKQDQDDEALRAIAAVVADRLENISEDSKSYVDTNSIEYRELMRAAGHTTPANPDRNITGNKTCLSTQ